MLWKTKSLNEKQVSIVLSKQKTVGEEKKTTVQIFN